jgi:hypothetical protein
MINPQNHSNLILISVVCFGFSGAHIYMCVCVWERERERERDERDSSMYIYIIVKWKKIKKLERKNLILHKMHVILWKATKHVCTEVLFNIFGFIFSPLKCAKVKFINKIIWCKMRKYNLIIIYSIIF